MRRHLLTVASAVALLVCLAAAALAFASRNESIALRRFDPEAGRSDWNSWVGRGGVGVRFFRPEVPKRVIGHWDKKTNTPTGYKELQATARTTRLQLLGFEVGRNVPFVVIGLDDITLLGFTTQVTIPWWLVFAAAAPLPLWRVLALRRLLRRRRRERGLCPECGYDLRGSKAAGRCPECGTAFQSVSTEILRALFRRLLGTPRADRLLPSHAFRPA